MMRAAWQIAISTLWARRLRSALLIAAVALATAMVVTVASGIDTVNESFRKGLTDMLGRSDATLRHTTGANLPRSMLDSVLQWPEVERLAVRTTVSVRLVNLRTNLDVVVTGQGVDFADDAVVLPVAMNQGRWPSASDEMTLDPRVRDLLKAELGDEIEVGDPGRSRMARVVGINQRVVFSLLQQPEVRIDRGLLESATGTTDEFTTASIILHSGVTGEMLAQAHARDLPPGAVIEPGALAMSGLDRNLRAGDIAFYLAACFAALAAGFIVLTGMTTALTERVREFGTLRSIGAERSHLFLAQLITGVVIGMAGGALGLLLGRWFAGLLYAHILTDVVRVPMQLTTGSLGVALLCSLVAGVGGGLLPAMVALRISPLQALSNRAHLPDPRGVLAASVCGTLALAGMAAIVWGPWDAQIAAWGYVSVGVPLMVVGWFLLAVPITSIAVWLVGSPLEQMFVVPHGLVREAARATPYRHGFTAGGLMLGLGVLIGPSSAGRGMLADWVEKIRFPDAFIISLTGLKQRDVDWIQSRPEFSNACPIGLFPVRARLAGNSAGPTSPPAVDSNAASSTPDPNPRPLTDDSLVQAGSESAPMFGLAGVAPEHVNFVSFDPDAFFAMTNIDWVQGDPQRALERLRQGDAILVAREFLTARDIGVGSMLTLGPRNNEHTFEVVGVVASPGLDIATAFFGMQREFYEQAVHCVFGNRSDASRYFQNERIRMLQFELGPDVTEHEAEDLIHQNLGAVHFDTGRKITQTIDLIAGRVILLAQTVGLLGLVVASFGMASVMAANVSARRAEFGILRAVGASRGVILRVILAEATLIALGACVAGTLLGFTGAWNASRVYVILLGIVSTPEIPWPTLWAGYGIVLGLSLVSCVPIAVGVVRQTPRAMLSDVASS